jgi:hypothetical protein
VVKPLRIERWRYRDVLTFVMLTSPPALLYAIPVEMLTDLETATQINVVFLAIVAIWRIALWLFYLMRGHGMPAFAAVVCELLPLCLIVVGLLMLNLERATFDLMGGMRHTAKDGAYMVVWCLSLLAIVLFVPLLVSWGVLAKRAHDAAKARAAREAQKPAAA